MTHKDHVRLLEKGISAKGGVWADMGSGEGAFTLALRDITGEDVEIYSIDRNDVCLEVQRGQFEDTFPNTNIRYITADFRNPLTLPPLDGIVMANSLHFSKDNTRALAHMRSYLKDHGRLLVVEYNVDEGNQWVPYPISFVALEKLLPTVGFTKPELLATIPSDFLHEIYAAVAFKSK
jgi:ubiquinone/menaquinone biosynthesis C-methylase UbiE